MDASCGVLAAGSWSLEGVVAIQAEAFVLWPGPIWRECWSPGHPRFIPVGMGFKPRHDGMVRHEAFAISLVAVMTTRQLPKGRNQQTLLRRVVGKAGKPEPVATVANAGNWMNMTADIEQLILLFRRCFRFMA